MERLNTHRMNALSPPMSDEIAHFGRFSAGQRRGKNELRSRGSELVADCDEEYPRPETRGVSEVERNINKENTLRLGTIRPTAFGSTVRAFMLACATLTTGLVAGVYYAYAVSVNLGLAAQPDASYVATMQAINERIENPLFFLTFFGAALFPLAALAAYYRRPRSGQFWLVALACVLYIGGSFLLTSFVSVPMNNQLAAVDLDAPAQVLADARDAYEGPWGFWNGVRAVFSVLAFLALIGACLLREDRRQPGGRSR
jgi:uncharacterized membrane protein